MADLIIHHKLNPLPNSNIRAYFHSFWIIIWGEYCRCTFTIFLLYERNNYWNFNRLFCCYFLILTTWSVSPLDSNIVSLDDITELSGDSPEPNDLDNNPNVLPSSRTQTEKGELLRTEVVEIKENEVHKKDEKRRKKKGKKNRQKYKAHQKEEKPDGRKDEERRRLFEEEELQLEKELIRKRQGVRTRERDSEEQYESDEDDGTFPIPVPPIEAPPLPAACSTSESTVSCINAKLTQIPPISDPDLTSLDLTGN